MVALQVRVWISTRCQSGSSVMLACRSIARRAMVHTWQITMMFRKMTASRHTVETCSISDVSVWREVNDMDTDRFLKLMMFGSAMIFAVMVALFVVLLIVVEPMTFVMMIALIVAGGVVVVGVGYGVEVVIDYQE